MMCSHFDVKPLSPVLHHIHNNQKIFLAVVFKVDNNILFYFIILMELYSVDANKRVWFIDTKSEFKRSKILHHGITSHVRNDFLDVHAALTRSTSLSVSEVSEGKCRLTRSVTLSFRSTLGPVSLSPSPEDWTTGTEDRCSRTSLRKSARPPEPARTSQGMLFLRERSTL